MEVLIWLSSARSRGISSSATIDVVWLPLIFSMSVWPRYADSLLGILPAGYEFRGFLELRKKMQQAMRAISAPAAAQPIPIPAVAPVDMPFEPELVMPLLVTLLPKNVADEIVEEVVFELTAELELGSCPSTLADVELVAEEAEGGATTKVVARAVD